MATQQQIEAGISALYDARGKAKKIAQQVEEVIKAAEQAAWRTLEEATAYDTVQCVSKDSKRAFEAFKDENGLWVFADGTDIPDDEQPILWQPLTAAPNDHIADNLEMV